jgi:uncharacterized protein (DUF697 family)
MYPVSDASKPKDISMPRLEHHQDQFSSTEAHVYREIQAFKTAEPSLSQKFRETVDDRIGGLIDKIKETSTGATTEQAIDAVLQALNESSSKTLRPEKIWENFHDEGLSISSLNDVRTLELEAIERVVDGLDRKYNTVALVEGAAAGAIGLAGAFADLPALVGIYLRAINEYAICYGFDVDTSDEQAMAALTLAAAASTGETRKEMFDRVEEHARSIQERSSQESEAHDGEVPQPVMNQVAQEIVTRLVRGSLAQSIPLVGALVGGGINRAFVKHVCQTARRVYEERWLMCQYQGAEAIKD